MRLTLIFPTCFLLACATSPVPMNLLDDHGERRLLAEDAVQVALSEADRGRIEYWKMTSYGEARPVSTGPIWQFAFVGKAGSDPMLTIKSASLTQEVAGGGFTARFVYSVDSVLAVNGVEHSIHGEGSRSASMNIVSAMRQAVELGVKDTAGQAAKILTISSRPD